MKEPDSVGERRKKAAQKYKPEKVRLLLVAEAPPNAPDRYFYFENVTSHDWLFRAVCEVLFGAIPDRLPQTKANMLERLKHEGIFLIDVCEAPITEGANLANHLPSLGNRCVELNPDQIILIKATVYDQAFQYLNDKELPVVNKRLYFPSNGRQAEFRTHLTDALKSIGWVIGVY